MEIATPAEAILGLPALSGGELVLFIVMLVVLFGANRLPPFARGLGQGIKTFRRASREAGRELGESLGAGLGKPVADALTHSNQSWEFQDPPALRLRQIRKQMKNRFILWIAQGFGAGRISFAPGTFGWLVGVLWFAVLLLPGNFWFYIGGTFAGILLSVPFCGGAEKILRGPAPASVVLDEIVAMPVCFVVWVSQHLAQQGVMPAPEYFFSRGVWPLTVAVFATFRLFDIAKPWPVRQSQKLPGGWGVTVDDVLAAIYVNVLVALVSFIRPGP